jgi:DNA invertase Pin-like site-specific DNA recombinase
MVKNKERKVGIYARLSKEDSRSGESVSIENQKLMLSKHVKEMGWELVEVYQDGSQFKWNERLYFTHIFVANVYRLRMVGSAI